MASSSRSRSGRPVTRGEARDRSATLTQVAATLRRGELVYDRVFDEVFPWQLRRASAVHWTPVEVAVRAAELLTDGLTRPSILDLGSGIGKFCTVAALVRGNARIRGIEQRAHLVDVAREAARTLGVEGALDFVHGSIADHEPAGFDGFYLFNPFGENLASREDHLDETVELGAEVYWRDVAVTECFLARARPGARVVTYCGWGGKLPPDFELVHRERRAGLVEVWRKKMR
ncbi:MAG: prmA1 [Labilithrix sp.]|nr:prmA1 [Labilithrix sp.]